MGGALDEQATLQRLLHRARAVLFDFDGPVTDLFRAESTAPVATEIKDTVRRIWGRLDDDVEACDDSHGILRHLRDMYDRPAVVLRDPGALREAEAIVTRQEYDAVKRAEPTPQLVESVDALLDLGLRLVIVSNNSEGPVWEFLKRWGLQSKFDTVIGRDPHELRHMKPHPDSVDRALSHLGVRAEDAPLIGDQLTDLQAARAAGTPFLGHTPSAERAEEMRDQGADWVVGSHLALLKAAAVLHESSCP